MRTVGIIIIWIVALTLIAFAGLVGLTLISAEGDAETIGWIIGLGVLFGLPFLALVAALLLVGAVLSTSGRKRPDPPRVNPDNILVMLNGDNVPRTGRPRPTAPTLTAAPREQDLLRAAFQTPPVKDRIPKTYIVITLRVLALAIFGWMFLPDFLMQMKIGGMMGMTFYQMAVVVVPMAVWAAILPLILWLVSNLLKRADEGQSEPRSYGRST